MPLSRRQAAAGLFALGSAALPARLAFAQALAQPLTREFRSLELLPDETPTQFGTGRDAFEHGRGDLIARRVRHAADDAERPHARQRLDVRRARLNDAARAIGRDVGFDDLRRLDFLLGANVSDRADDVDRE